MVDTDVLIAGAGPVRLTVAIELARRRVGFRIVDPSPTRRSTRKPLVYSRVRSRSSRAWGCGSLLGRRDHALLLYAGEGATADDVAAFERVAEAAVAAAHGHIDVYLIAAPSTDVAATVLPLIRDGAGDFARAYGAAESAAYLVRPDGFLSFASSRISADDLVAHLSTTFGASVSTTAAPDLG